MSTKYIASNWRLPNKAGVDSYLNDNYGLTFDGGEYIDLGTSVDLGTNSTISFWFKSSAGNSNNTIIGENTYTFDYLLQIVSASNEANIRIGSIFKTYTGITEINDGNWNHWVIVRSGDSLELFINNTSKGIKTGYGTGTNTKFNKIGAEGDNQFPISGEMSEVSAFNYALSSTQVSTLYGSSELGSASPLALKPAPVAFYPLGDNSSGNPLTQPNEAVEDASVFDFIPNDDISCGTNSIFDITENITLSGWINRDVNTNTDVIVSKWASGSNTAYLLRVKTTGGASGNSKIEMLIRNTSGTLVTAAEDVGEVCINKWAHIMGTYNGSTIRLFYNGVELGSGTAQTGNIQTSTAPFRIGSRGSEYTDGKLSNIAIWNSDQSSEVSNIYNSGVPATSYTNTPTAWYKLDQSANWEADSSGAWQIPDAVSAYPQSFNFDGSGEHIDASSFDNALLSDGDISFSLWCKLQTTGTYQYILSSEHTGTIAGINIAMHPNTKLSFSRAQDIANTQNGTGYTVLGFSLGNWHHLCGTYNATSGELKAYVDGNLKSTTNDIADARTASTPLKIGGLSTYATLYAAKGQISNVQIWNTTLLDSQVETLYNNGVPLTTAIASDNLKAWYKLDNTATFSTNWSIPDASGNGNTGTSSGMTEQNLVNNNVSALNGESSGMTSANLVLSDLTRAVPYDSYSFNFDGANDYIECGDSDIFSFGNGSSDSPFSISAWVNFDDVSTSVGIISKYANTNATKEWLFYIAAQNFRLLLQDGSYNNFATATSTTISTNQWYHVVGTYNGVGGANANQGMNIYVNGQPQTLSYAGSSNYVAMDNTSAVVRISRYGTGAYMDGKQSNISIFNNELTSTEVQKLYANGMPQDLSTFTPAPIAFYPLGSNSFWNGSQWTVRDMIGSNDGTGQNIGVDGLVGDAPRSEANGTGTNMDIESNIALSTKWSSNNSISINMSSEARVQDTP